MFFEIVGELSEAETFAIGKSIRELPRLRKLNGKGRRRKQKGLAGVRLPNGTMRKALGGSAMTSRRMKTKEFAVCIRNAGFGASLEVRKLYSVVADPDAEANDLIRVVDESGDDYVYPARLFQRLALPVDVQRALLLAS